MYKDLLPKTLTQVLIGSIFMLIIVLCGVSDNKDSKIKELEKITYQQQTEIDNLTYQRNQCMILYRGQ